MRIEAPAKRPVVPDRGEGPDIYTVVAPDASPWYGAALDQISGLTALAVGWNGYDAREVKADMAIDAAKFLTRVAFPGIAAPSIVPLSDGGMQIEWHRGGVDIEVAFSDDEPGVYVVDREGEGAEVELPLTRRRAGDRQATGGACKSRDPRRRAGPRGHEPLPPGAPDGDRVERQRRVPAAWQRRLQGSRDVDPPR